MILLRFRLPGLKSIYLLWEHYIKSVAESSYSLLRGREFSLQMSLPGVIPVKQIRIRRLHLRYPVLVTYPQSLILTQALLQQPPVIVKRDVLYNTSFVHVSQLDRVWVVQVGLGPAPVTCNAL
jgi:hypothetical protein